MLFGRKKKEIPYQIEDVPKLPTIEEILKDKKTNQQNIQTAQEVKPQSQNNSPASTQEQTQPQIVEIKVKPIIQPAKTVETKVKEEREARIAAPLFVKLDRYKQILNHLAQLKTSIVLLKNNLTVLNELEKLRDENLKLVQEALEKMEKRVLDLDSELLRPSGFREELLPHMEEVASIEATIAELKSQIEQLRGSLTLE